NESGTLYRTWTESKDKTNFMVVGNNLMMNLIYGHTIRKAVGERANIVCVLDKKSNVIMKSEKLDSLAEKTFNALHYVNILRPLEAKSNLGEEAMFDMSVNCAEIPGAETLNILATRYGGTVVFANLINNYNLALYVTEALSRQLNIRCADGYLAKYDEFDIDIITDLVPYFEGVKIASIRNNASIEKAMKTRGKERVRADDFISGSPAMEAVLEEIMSVAKYDCNVLITGDTGVGKEKVANLIVKNSMRSMQPLIKLNCAAIAPNLMESEFFGYEAGAFTGAKDKGKKGYFETADNGTVFLDEVGEMPLDIQAKLLRVIQDGEFFRVGGAKPIKTNVRIIAATNRDLLTRVEEKEFRRDLYYRLNVFQIKVPSLRERREDIPPLVQYFLKKYGEKFNVKRGIDEDALELLVQSDWKGNIRELENVVQRLLIGARSENITLIEVGKELHRELFETPKLAQIEEGTEGLNLEKMVEDFERQIIKYACEKYGSTRKAAKAIGISQTQLVRKKNKYEI
ncbi:MAG: sigma-54 dependent transcriptional regulator, partial [Anaerovoracaceae bacterium]